MKVKESQKIYYQKTRCFDANLPALQVLACYSACPSLKAYHGSVGGNMEKPITENTCTQSQQLNNVNVRNKTVHSNNTFLKTQIFIKCDQNSTLSQLRWKTPTL